MGRPAGPLHELQAQEGACAEFLANEGAMVGEVEKQRNGIPVAVVAQHAAWCHGGVRERH